MEETQRDLIRLIRYGSGLQQLMSELGQAAPERSEGSDTSGMVRVTIAADGLPSRISVQSRWQDRLTADSLSAAVTEAWAAAQQHRGEAWARALERSGWQQRMDRLEAEAEQAAAAATDPVPAAFRRPAADVPPRPLPVLYDEVMSAADVAMARSARAPREPSTAVGSNRQRTVTVSLTPAGQLTCQADARWVSGRSGAELTEVLNAALSMARAGIAAADGEEAARTAGQDRLMAEVFATLENVAKPNRAPREPGNGEW